MESGSGVKSKKLIKYLQNSMYNDAINSKNLRFSNVVLVYFGIFIFQSIFFSDLEFVLYDLNRTVNEEIGREVFDYYGFPENQDNAIVISYKNVGHYN